MLVDTLEQAADELAAIQALPESLIVAVFADLAPAEQAVMLAMDFFQAITHGMQEVVVGVQHLALQVELNQCGGAVDGAHQVA